MNKMELNAYNNDWFKSTIGASALRQVCWYFINILFFINPLNPSVGLKIWLLKRFGAVIGAGVIIKPGVSIKYPWKLTIGDYCWIGEKVWIDNLTDVSIGKNVCISQGAMLLTGNHDYKKIKFDLIIRPIVLEDGTWIGAKSLVCPGVTVSSHAVLAAASVAVRNLESYMIYQGNPAIAIRTRQISDL